MNFVSIVIPAYNASKCISEAIESIIKQDYNNYEIIVVDDGSTDSTYNTLKKYIDDKTLRYYYQTNAGPGSARNKGMREACGDYICFLDADDELIERSLKKRVQFLDKNPDIKIVFTDYFKKYSKSDIKIHLKGNNFLTKFKRAVISESGNTYLFNDLFFECAIQHNPFILTSTVMMTADLVKTIGFFDENLRVAEDVDYWLKVCRKYKTGFIDEPLTNYNNYRSVLTKNDIKYFEDSIQYYSSLFDEIEIRSNETIAKLLKNKLSELEFNYGYFLFHNKRSDSSKRHFRQSFYLKRNNLLAIKWVFFSLFPKSILYLKHRISSNQHASYPHQEKF